MKWPIQIAHASHALNAALFANLRAHPKRARPTQTATCTCDKHISVVLFEQLFDPLQQASLIAGATITTETLRSHQAHRHAFNGGTLFSGWAKTKRTSPCWGVQIP